MLGQFFFAWVLPTDNVFGVSHHVEDERVYAFTLDHSEGDFAGLSLDIKNPRIGLLNATRKTWAWLSVDNGLAVVPLFFGRLVGIPDNIQNELVRLQFTARPSNFRTVKAALAETLKVPPYYDPIWIEAAARNDPDTVLEAYSALWHIDRASHVVSSSDVLVGEDGNEDFLANEVPYDSVSIRLNQPPLRSVTVDGQVHWTQTATGQFDFPFHVNRTFLTYTGASLISDWPKPNTNLDAGWSVTESFAIDVLDIAGTQTVSMSSSFQNEQPTHADGDTMSLDNSKSFPLLKGNAIQTNLVEEFGIVIGDPSTGQAASSSTNISTMYVPIWQVDTSLILKYEAKRERTEHVVFTLKANVQSIVTLPEEDDTLLINLSSVDVGELIGVTIPIGNISRRAYFPTGRGLQSLEYLIAVARSTLLLRSRAVEVEFQCKFLRAITLSCRKNARLFDHRLPGGQAIGKIVKYSIVCDGKSGRLFGTVTIGCAIGYGGAVVAVLGTPSYVEEGYFDPGEVQVYIGQTQVLTGGNVSYSIPIDAPNDDGLVFPLRRSQAIVNEQVHGSYTEQALAIVNAFPAEMILANTDANSIEAQTALAQANKQTVSEALKTVPVSYELELKPVTGGPFETVYNIVLSELKIPKMIDLEADSI